MISPQVQALLILQDRDQRLRRLRHDTAHIPKEQAALNSRLAAARGRVEARQAEIKELESKRRGMELEVQSKQQQIGRYKTQQMQTRKNEEYAALGNEITHAETDVRLIEDRELDVMERIEECRATLLKEERELVEFEKEIEGRRKALAEKAAQLEGSLDEAEAQMREARGAVEESVLQLYDRIMASKKDAAVVPLHGHVCTGCHMQLTADTAHRAEKGDGIVQCENCGRIVYAAE